MGITFGGYTAYFHPGYTPIPGVFRMQGGWSVGNTSLGFVPKVGVMHHMEVLTQLIGGSLRVDIAISGEGTDNLPHTFNYSFLDPTPNLGTGTFGGRRSGGGNALSDGIFDNFQVQFVPEPSSAILLSLGILGMYVLCRRRRSSR